MQVVGGVSGQHQTKAEGHKLMLGNMCLLANTAAMSVYFITAKQLVLKYPPMCVAAWAYITAAVCMGASAAAFVDRNQWQMPSIMFGPLVYWIIVCSIIGYYVVTWATQYLPASQVGCQKMSLHKLLPGTVLMCKITRWMLVSDLKYLQSSLLHVWSAQGEVSQPLIVNGKYHLCSGYFTTLLQVCHCFECCSFEFATL